MWLEQYPLSFFLFLASGFVLVVGVMIDERKGLRDCNEQQLRVSGYKAFADSWEVSE